MASLPTGVNNRDNPYYLKPNHIKIAKEVQTKAEYLGSGPTNITLPTVAPALTNGEYVVGVTYTASGASADPSGEGTVDIRYYWVVDGVQQAEGASYTPVSGDAGDSMYWRVEYEETGGTSPGLVVRTGGVANVAVPLIPVIASSNFDDSTDIWTVTTDTPSNGNWVWGRFANGTTGVVADGPSNDFTPAADLSGTIAVGTSPADLDIPEGGVTGTAYELFLYQKTSGGSVSNVLTVSYTADNTAPTLSNIVFTAGDTEADIDWHTDEGNGQAFWVLTTSSTTPSQEQIEEGNDHTGGAAFASGAPSVTTIGAQNIINVTGLTNGTTYYFYIFHKDSHRNSSSTGAANGTPTVPGLTLAYLTQDLTIAGGTTYNFTPTLSSAANKRVYVHVGINHVDSATSVTIGGVAATLVTGTSTSVTSTRSEIWYADLGASPTDTLQVVANISASACGFSAWSVDGTITSHTGNSDTALGVVAPWTADLDLTTVADSVVMAGGFSSNKALAVDTETGVTRNGLSTDTNRTQWGASNSSPGAGAPHTITVGDTTVDLGRWTCSSVEVR